MRLICPNCGAQYEIDDGMIPAEGRDVQCSNCAHTWFETPGASVQAETLAEDVETQVSQPQPEPASAPTAPPSALVSSPPQPEPAPQPTPDPEPRAPSQLDPDVAAILREEAEHERARRSKAAETIESQPDLGLDAPARDKGEVTGRDKLPDIEEINSSLRGGDGAAPDTVTTKTRHSGGGFWQGFLLMVLIALALVLFYTGGPKIAAKLPQAAPVVDSYRDGVDGLRLQLNDMAQQLGTRLNQYSAAE